MDHGHVWLLTAAFAAFSACCLAFSRACAFLLLQVREQYSEVVVWSFGQGGQRHFARA